MKTPFSARRLRFHKRSIGCASLCVFLYLAGVSLAQAQCKVGVVEMNKIFTGYYKTKDAENKLNDARETARKELEDRMESHKQLLDEINQLNGDVDNLALSATTKADRSKKREDKIQQVRTLENEINDFKNSREKQLQEQAVRMRNQIVEEIMKLIEDRVKIDNYDLVFDKSGQSLGGVQFLLHSKDSMDFSDDILTALNRTRPPAVSIATPAPRSSPKR
jgi:outer membrane protein